jgi:hypothetical protein
MLFTELRRWRLFGGNRRAIAVLNSGETGEQHGEFTVTQGLNTWTKTEIEI